jgi:FtsP/CotA-like multicopper oxidase with cupredoxin domain
MLPPLRPLLVATAVLCFSLCSSLMLLGAEAKVRHYDWNISYQHKSPDCFEKLAVTVNGEAPGPTIRATQGDTIVVTVHNKLETENTAIHWHGIRQVPISHFRNYTSILLPHACRSMSVHLPYKMSIC